jgi:hypothetical protein
MRLPLELNRDHGQCTGLCEERREKLMFGQMNAWSGWRADKLLQSARYPKMEIFPRLYLSLYPEKHLSTLPLRF